MQAQGEARTGARGYLARMEPREIRPGLFHWTAPHPDIRTDVSSYLVATARVVLDPLLPAGGIDWLREHGPPEHVVMTNRLHWRQSSEIVAELGCTVWCPEVGRAHLAGRAGADRVRGYRPGDELPGGITAHEVGAICADEMALLVPLEDGTCLAVADGVVRMGEGGRGDGPLSFVPDALLVDDPAELDAVKDGLRAACRRLCELEWDTLLLAHGFPVVGDGREQLRAFAAG